MWRERKTSFSTNVSFQLVSLITHFLYAPFVSLLSLTSQRKERTSNGGARKTRVFSLLLVLLMSVWQSLSNKTICSQITLQERVIKFRKLWFRSSKQHGWLFTYMAFLSPCKMNCGLMYVNNCLFSHRVFVQIHTRDPKRYLYTVQHERTPQKHTTFALSSRTTEQTVF